MKKHLVLLVGLLGLASAQGVRSLGMGGLVLPGPGAAGLNPAYAAYPAGPDEGWRAPLGLIRFLPFFTDTSPLTYWTDPNAFRTGFDALSFYDQLTHLDSFLLNPARSPDEVVFRIRADRLEVTDGQGNPLNLNFGLGQTAQGTTSLYPEPFFWLPLGEGDVYLKLGLFVGVEGLSVAPSPELVQALAGNLEICRSSSPSPCALEAQGKASAGVALALGWAGALPEVPGLGRVYVGVRGQGFYGLLYGELNASARPVFDQDGNPTGVDYEVGGFYAYPGRGQGWGLRGDLGVVVDLGDATLGLGVQNALAFATWEGYEFKLGPNGPTDETPASRTSSLSSPSFFVNGVYRFRELGLLVGVDARFGSTALSGHLGGEYALGPARLRAGVGLEGGLKFGVGAGLELGGVGVDLALTAHEAPLVSGTVYGVAVAVRF
jgi:hypothetical protein